MQKTTHYFFMLFILLPILWSYSAYSHENTFCETDDTGIKLRLKKKPTRIISLAPSTTELLYAAGAGKQVIAVDNYSDYPPVVKKLPKVGGYPNISFETLVSLKPDLIVVWSGGNSPRLIQQIESSRLALFRLEADHFTAIAADIEKLGSLTGNIRLAHKNATLFIETLNRIKARYHQQQPISVFFEIWSSPLMTVGGQQIINEVITLCGGHNIYADTTTKIPLVSMESLLSINPDIIIATHPTGESKEKTKAMTEYWSKWPSLTAVKKQQLFSVPADLIARPSPRILQGAEILCHYLESVRKDKKP
ncbi:Vitamin B12-binding protein [invertebrate metagenome]|uniref:Vitamin B12-binding protein n=1 Tax=invertebrate metagenome TaxID=1711999 RepID=A0A2H9T7I6_9ZZZZ